MLFHTSSLDLSKLSGANAPFNSIMGGRNAVGVTGVGTEEKTASPSGLSKEIPPAASAKRSLLSSSSTTSASSVLWEFAPVSFAGRWAGARGHGLDPRMETVLGGQSSPSLSPSESAASRPPAERLPRLSSLLPRQCCLLVLYSVCSQCRVGPGFQTSR